MLPKDQASLIPLLDPVQKSGLGVLEALGTQGAPTRDAMRMLQNVLERGIADDAVQRWFSEDPFATLTEVRSDPKLIPYEWAISENDIKVDGTSTTTCGISTALLDCWPGGRVVVKRLKSDTLPQSLIKEINSWRCLQHPHIMPFFRACLDSNPPFLVSEFCQYGNVLSYLADHPSANRVILSHEIALGMQFLHAKNIWHGNLKPTNVLIDNARSARITDYGISKIMTSQRATSLDTNKQPGAKVFMAPERLRRGTLTFATDVYAYAMTLYQIFTGEAPFQHLPEEDLYKVVVERGQRPEYPEGREIMDRGLSLQFWGLICKCWQDDRTLRPDFTAILASFTTTIPRSLSLCIPSIAPSRFANRIHAVRTMTFPLGSPSAVPAGQEPHATWYSSRDTSSLDVVFNDESDFPCGIRTITNVRSHNLAVLLDGNLPSNVVSGIVENRANEKWIISRASNQKFFIENYGYNSFVAHETGTGKDPSVVAVLKRQQWLIKKTRVKGQYTISPSDNPDLYWALPNNELETKVVLRTGSTNDRHQWRFS